MISKRKKLDRIERLLSQGPLSLDDAAEVFFQTRDTPLSDREVARLVERVDEKRWLAENVWSFGDDPVTLWMNQVEDCQIELAALELAQETTDLGWSVVVKTPGSDELPHESPLGDWFARAQDVAASLIAAPEPIVAPGW